MLRKLLVMACLAVLPVLSMSSPAAMEREAFCDGLGQMAAQAAAARNLGYPLDSFNEKLAELKVALANPDVGLSIKEQKEVIRAMVEAYALGGPPGTRGMEAFQACMKSKEV